MTQVLKDEWSFLRDETDNLLKSIEHKGEFETSAEFEQRIAKAKSAYLNKIEARIKEKKFDHRVFGVLFKATLASYSADTGVYSISCPVSMEVPYNIPSVVCYVPSNDFVALGDTIVGGYRTSKLFLRFFPNFRWRIGRDIALQVKNEEPNLYFKVHFVIDIAQAGIVNQAKIRIVPKNIMLYNGSKRGYYWRKNLL